MLGEGDDEGWVRARNYKGEVTSILKLLTNLVFSSLQGHHELSGKSDENKSFKPNQIVPSIYIMIELCFFSLDK